MWKKLGVLDIKLIFQRCFSDLDAGNHLTFARLWFSSFSTLSCLRFFQIIEITLTLCLFFLCVCAFKNNLNYSLTGLLKGHVFPKRMRRQILPHRDKKGSNYEEKWKKTRNRTWGHTTRELNRLEPIKSCPFKGAESAASAGCPSLEICPTALC